MDMNFVLSSQQRMVVGGTKKQYEYGADKVKGTVRIIALFVCLCVCVFMYSSPLHSMNNDLNGVRLHWRRSPLSDTSGIA